MKKSTAKKPVAKAEEVKLTSPELDAMSRQKAAMEVGWHEEKQKGVAAKDAKVKESKKKLAGATPPSSTLVYSMGDKKYNPRVEHNSEAWSKVQGAITIKGKGKATHTELCEVLATHFAKTEENHHDFIGYMVRRGSLVIAKK